MSNPDAYSIGPAEALRWIARIAGEPAARYRNGSHRVSNAQRGFHELVRHRRLPRNAIDDMGFAFAVAEQAAQMFGVRGLEIVRLGSMALRHAMRPRRQGAPRNLSLRIGGYTVKPDVGTLSSLARVTGRLGWNIGSAALRAKLAEYGIGAPVIREVERELNREGLSLGALAKPPPMPGTLEALTTEALIKKRASPVAS